MSSNRLMYDTCAYKKKLEESTTPLDYTLYTGKYENCSKCRLELGQVGGNGVSLFSGNLVDLESDLRGQTRYASQCPDKKYKPRCSPLFNTTKNGLPCDGQNTENLVHQPTCQMVSYPAVVMPERANLRSCNYQSN